MRLGTNHNTGIALLPQGYITLLDQVVFLFKGVAGRPWICGQLDCAALFPITGKLAARSNLQHRVYADEAELARKEAAVPGKVWVPLIL